MNLLLDTHVLLRAACVPERLSAPTRAMLEAPGTAPVFSAASLWEVVIENGLGRADFDVDPHLLRRGLLENGYTELTVTGLHVAVLRPPWGSVAPRRTVSRALVAAGRRYPPAPKCPQRSCSARRLPRPGCGFSRDPAIVRRRRAAPCVTSARP